MNKVFKPESKAVKAVSEQVTKTMMTTSKENNIALQNLNNKVSEIVNDRGIITLTYNLFYLKLLILKINLNLNY